MNSEVYNLLALLGFYAVVGIGAWLRSKRHLGEIGPFLPYQGKLRHWEEEDG
jgi:hypothetical protein